MIELILFGLTPEVKPSPLVQQIIETQTVQVEPPPIQEPTLEEKIATNYYKCDESIQYIRADNANCIDKPQIRVPERRSSTERTNTPIAAKNATTAPVGWYKKGQCTWYVWTKRPVGQWGDATEWKRQALRDGYTVSKTPKAGAIAWKRGHVAFIESVNENGVVISEANYDYKGSIRTITIKASEYEYIY